MESGEGIESILPIPTPLKAFPTTWNPVKELKEALSESTKVFSDRRWNPVKELKVVNTLTFTFTSDEPVESGEGIESGDRCGA